MRPLALLIAALLLAACEDEVQPRAGVGIGITPDGVSVNPSVGASIGGLGVSYTP